MVDRAGVTTENEWNDAVQYDVCFPWQVDNHTDERRAVSTAGTYISVFIATAGTYIKTRYEIRQHITYSLALSNEEKDFLHMTLQMNHAQRPDVETLMQSSYLQQKPPRSAHV